MIHEDEACEKCGNLNSVVQGICCTCHWHNEEHRRASLEEVKEIETLLSHLVRNMLS